MFNNPLKYTDPSGHVPCIDGILCGGSGTRDRESQKRAARAADRSTGGGNNNSGSGGNSGNGNTGSGDNIGGGGESNPRAQVADPEQFGYPSIETLESVYHEWVFSNPHYTRYAGIDNDIILELIQSTTPAWQNYLPPAPTFQEWSFYHGYVLNTYGDRILSAPGGVDFAQYPTVEQSVIMVGLFLGNVGEFGAPPSGTGIEPIFAYHGDTSANLESVNAAAAVFSGALQVVDYWQTQKTPYQPTTCPWVRDVPEYWYYSDMTAADVRSVMLFYGEIKPTIADIRSSE